MLHYPLDFIISLMWFASFGALFDWVNNNNVTCSGIFGAWTWDGDIHDMYCNEYQAAEGLALISGVLWLASALLVSDMEWHRRTHQLTELSEHSCVP
jgi:hypothetical protein